jgi:hypothetical protein
MLKIKNYLKSPEGQDNSMVLENLVSVLALIWLIYKLNKIIKDG